MRRKAGSAAVEVLPGLFLDEQAKQAISPVLKTNAVYPRGELAFTLLHWFGSMFIKSARVEICSELSLRHSGLLFIRSRFLAFKADLDKVIDVFPVQAPSALKHSARVIVKSIASLIRYKLSQNLHANKEGIVTAHLEEKGWRVKTSMV